MDFIPIINNRRIEKGQRECVINHKWNRLLGISVLLSIVAQIGLLALLYFDYKDAVHFQQSEINHIKEELTFLKNKVFEDWATLGIDAPRNRREINRVDHLSSHIANIQSETEKSPIIVEAKYSEAQKNGTYKGRNKTEGLRIYGSWFKNGQETFVQGRSTPSPILKHHRRHKSSSNKVSEDVSRTKKRQLRRANKLNQKHYSVAHSGLKSVHFESQNLENPSVSTDGRYQYWQPSQWSSRMRAETFFPLKNGTVRVSSPGVYFVYAQINYLDENDVNAFQILKNDDPLFMCTTMTKTPGPSTKANTCYTAGVVYLEQGDSISLRDLEPGRTAILRPSHSFFGLIQISNVGI